MKELSSIVFSWVIYIQEHNLKINNFYLKDNYNVVGLLNIHMAETNTVAFVVNSEKPWCILSMAMRVTHPL